MGTYVMRFHKDTSSRECRYDRKTEDERCQGAGNNGQNSHDQAGIFTRRILFLCPQWHVFSTLRCGARLTGKGV